MGEELFNVSMMYLLFSTKKKCWAFSISLFDLLMLRLIKISQTLQLDLPQNDLVENRPEPEPPARSESYILIFGFSLIYRF